MRYRGGLTGVLGFAIAITLLAAGGATASPTTASRHGHGARPPLRLRVLTTSEGGALHSGVVRVGLTTRRGVRVRLYATAVTLRSKHSVRSTPVVVSHPRTVRLRRAGRHTLSLRLLSAGRRELSRCVDEVVEVDALVIGARAASHGPTIRARRRLRAGIRVCGRRRNPGAGPGGAGGTGGASHPIAYATPSNAARCDFLDMAVCMQPFPNDYLTVPDATTDTRRRVSFNILSMPSNRAGKPIDPTDWNRNDGFSPGSSMFTRVPGLDTPAAFARTGAVPITDMARSFDANQPVVVINTRTRQRQLIWSELDANPTDPSKVNLIIRPGVNLDEGTRYIVALRHLRNASGSLIPADGAFRLYRDAIVTTNPLVESRRAHFEDIFDTLAQAGIDRADLYRAWDFTVASRRNLTERVLAMRDDAFAKLGDTNLSDVTVQGRAPSFAVTQTTNFTPCAPAGCKTGQSNDLIRQVQGRFLVPCYLDKAGCPSGSRFLYRPGSTNGPPLAIPGNTYAANFICNIPRSALQGTTVMPVRPLLYGHGLLGTADQINGDDHTEMARRHRIMFCATDWIGMAQEDVPNDVGSLGDLSQFSTLADRVQQGMIDFLYLGRLMIHPQGFSSSPAFALLDGVTPRSVIDTRRLFYNGDSQGGIIGGALTAIAPDFNRAVLGDVGMNYGTLLQRSSDFGTGKEPYPNPKDPTALPQYAYPLYQAYPNEIERPLIYGLMEMLWDRSEADGYAHHMTTDTLPNTPPHNVLLHQPFGDHQVANVASEVEARTIGAHMHLPALDPGRSTSLHPYFAIPAIDSDPYHGPATFVTWDIGPLRTEKGQQAGTPAPPTQNVPPTQGDDPHGAPHAKGQLATEDQISAFLQIDGAFVNVCGSRPCYAGSWHGP